jgi:hypothetical protein
MVHERAQGNPLFTEELVAVLGESGAPYLAGDHARLTGMAEVEVPRRRVYGGARTGTSCAAAVRKGPLPLP